MANKAYARTGPQTPFPLPLTPYPASITPGNQNQYSIRQPLTQAIAALGDYMDDLTPTQSRCAFFFGGIAAGVALAFGGQALHKSYKKRK